ncbi:MAG: hypothetical protein KDB07_10710 [Planctomycetes bacterium]|nr:hypothetical protein [Planctomycetota bacterium]
MTEPAPSEAKKLADEAVALYNNRDYAAASPALVAAGEACQSGEESLRLKVWSLAARAKTIQGNLTEGEPLLERARAAREGADADALASFGVVEGIFIRERGDKEAAKAYFIKLADFCEENQLYAKAVDAIHHIAIVAPADEQEHWALKGIEAAERGGDATKGWLGALWNNLGWTYDEAGEHEKALDALLKAQVAHQANSGEYQKVAADAFVAHALIHVGRIDEAEKLNDGVRVVSDAKLADKPDDAHWQERSFYCDWKNGEIARARGELAKAKEALEKAKAGFQALNGKGWYDEWLVKLDRQIAALGE